MKLKFRTEIRPFGNAYVMIGRSGLRRLIALGINLRLTYFLSII